MQMRSKGNDLKSEEANEEETPEVEPELNEAIDDYKKQQTK